MLKKVYIVNETHRGEGFLVVFIDGKNQEQITFYPHQLQGGGKVVKRGTTRLTLWLGHENFLHCICYCEHSNN